MTDTPVAALGPLLVAVMVNVTLVPTFGVGLFTVFTMARSAVGVGPGETVLVLLPGMGSGSLPDMTAVLTYEPVAFTVAIMVKVALLPLARFPIVQLGAVQVPVEGVALTKV